VWALDVAPRHKTVVSGGGDSQILVWQDTTREAEDAKRAEREETILMDQKLANHLRHKEFMQALDISLNLDKPRLTLKVLNSIIETDMKEKRHPTASLKTYIPSWSMERVTQVLRYCREWNTRARNCDVAMLVIKAIVAVLPAEKLAAGDGVPEILAGITPYAERHFDRLDRLFASSYLLDFALFSMGSLDNDETDFSAWESQSKLVLPPAHTDGRIQIGGKAIVGGTGPVEDEESSFSTVGDSDSSSSDEE
jgi:U3 small nucleolar RNA-associated protein 13